MVRSCLVLLFTAGLQAASAQAPSPVEQGEWTLVPSVLAARAAAAYDWASGGLLVYGGSSQAAASTFWQRNGTQWVERWPAGPKPGDLSNANMVFDLARWEIVLVGSAPPDGPFETWTWNGVVWSRRQSTLSPPSRWYFALAYDPLRQRTVLHSGYRHPNVLNDTWEWDGTGWFQSSPTAVPPSRYSASMAFDPVSGQVILAGGLNRARADTWAFNGTTWTQVGNLPFARYGHAMVTDESAGRIVLHGGADGSLSHVILRDTLEWDGSAWTTVQTNGGPYLLGAKGAYDPATGVVLVGGAVDHSSASGDTWTYLAQQRTWRRDLAGRSPPTGGGNVIASYDRRRRRVVIHRPGTPEVWEWTGISWENIPAAGGPTVVIPRMAYHTPSGRTVLYGGRDPLGQSSNQTWEWDGTAWTRRVLGGSPPATEDHVLVEDPGGGFLLMFDAWNRSLWQWSGSLWAQVVSNTGPTRRSRPFGTFDTHRNVLILFGGDRGGLTDTWEWDGTRWTQVATAGPAMELDAVMTFDERRGVAVLYGARDWNEGTASEHWEYEPRSRRWGLIRKWPLAVTQAHAMVYDPDRGAIFLRDGGRSTLAWTYSTKDLLPARQEVPLGSRVSWFLNLPADAGLPFLTGLSLGGDGIPVSAAFGPALWPLRPDALFRVSLSMPSLRGVLADSGQGQAFIDVPNDPGLRGVYLAASALTLDPLLGIRSITRDVRAYIR